MRSMETSRPDIIQVTDQDLVVHHGSVLLRPQVVHAIQIGYVDTALIGLRTLVSIFIHIHAEEQDVLSIDVLE